MIQTESSSLTSIEDGGESTRRRSTFYVPLNPAEETAGGDKSASSPAVTTTNTPKTTTVTIIKKSVERLYPNNDHDLSGTSFDWSLNDSLNSTGDLLVSSEKDNKLKRYGIVLNGSINIDDSIELPSSHQQQRQNHTSTPIRLMKARSRSNILSSLPDKTAPPSPAKEKSKTLPQNMAVTPAANTFPPKSSFLLKSTPKIGLNYSSSENCGQSSSPSSSLSPKKSLSFIRRTHSTKLSRSNSLLRSLTSNKGAEPNNQYSQYNVVPLPAEYMERCFRSDCFEDAVKRMFFKEKTSNNETKDSVIDDDDDDSGAHSGK